MPVSLPRSQRNLLDSGFLDTLGGNEPDAVALTETSKAVLKVAGEFIDDCVTNLNRVDRISSGNLASTIRPVVVEAGQNNIIDIYMNDYYKFVDKGVRGWQDRSGSGSQYAFKKPTGKGGKGSSKMVTAIRKWVIRENMAIRNTKTAINPREQRRKSITDTSTQTAIVIAGQIRRKGLRKTNFFTDAVRTLEGKLASGVADALRIDVIENISP